jgi:uncharacterized phage infection (PIP) family protein YhgE
MSMPDIDKVLEAQKSIETLAEELKQLGTAAQLLKDTGEGVKAVLAASESILKSAGEFTTTSGEILKRLATVDIDNRLKNVESQIDKVCLEVQESQKTIVGQLTSGFGSNEKAISNGLRSIESQIDRVYLEVQKTQVVIVDQLALGFGSNEKGIKELTESMQKVRDQIVHAETSQSERLKSIESSVRALTSRVEANAKNIRLIMIGAFGFTWLLLIACLIKILL